MYKLIYIVNVRYNIDSKSILLIVPIAFNLSIGLLLLLNNGHNFPQHNIPNPPKLPNLLNTIQFLPFTNKLPSINSFLYKLFPLFHSFSHNFLYLLQRWRKWDNNLIQYFRPQFLHIFSNFRNLFLFHNTFLRFSLWISRCRFINPGGLLFLWGRFWSHCLFVNWGQGWRQGLRRGGW